jgi:hypothetical protein
MCNSIPLNIRERGGVLIWPLLISLFIHSIILFFIKTDFLEMNNLKYKKCEKYSVKLLLKHKKVKKSESRIESKKNKEFFEKLSGEIKSLGIKNFKTIEIFKEKIISIVKKVEVSKIRVQKKKRLEKKRIIKPNKINRKKSLKLNKKGKKKLANKIISKKKGDDNI